MVKICRAVRSVIPIVLTAVAASFIRDPLAAISGQTKSPPAEQAEVLIEREPGRMARHYTLSTGGCRTSWILFESSPDPGVIQNRTLCPKPLREQMPALSRILAAIMKDLGTSEIPRTLVWGRLTPDERQDDMEMAFRLALGAHKSASWNSKLGRPRSGHENTLAVQLANREMVYPELRDLFDAYGLELKFAHAEKVLILSAGKLPFFDRLKQANVGSSEKLPFDCIAYFTISKKPGKS